MANKFTGNEKPVGDGIGEPVTRDINVQRSSAIGPLMDPPGLRDARNHFTDDQLARRVALEVVSVGAGRLKVMVTESAANDTINLRNTLMHLAMPFGMGIMRPIAVTMTKADCRPRGSERDRRLNQIRKICTEFGIREVVLWQNVDINEEDCQLQLTNLQEALERAPGFVADDIRDLNDCIRQRAQQMRDEAPPITHEETYTVDVERQEQHPEHSWETVVSTKTAQAPVTTTMREGMNQVQQFSTFVVFGSGYDMPMTTIETLTTAKQVPMQVTRMVDRTVMQPETRTREVQIT